MRAPDVGRPECADGCRADRVIYPPIVDDKTSSIASRLTHPSVIAAVIGGVALIVAAFIQRPSGGVTTHKLKLPYGQTYDASALVPQSRKAEPPKVKFYVVGPDCGSISIGGLYQAPSLPDDASIQRTCHIVAVADDPARPSNGRAAIAAVTVGTSKP